MKTLKDVDEISLGKKQKDAIIEFNGLINKYRNLYDQESAPNIVRDLLADIDLLSYYENQNTQEALDRWSNVEELVNSIIDFLLIILYRIRIIFLMLLNNVSPFIPIAVSR